MEIVDKSGGILAYIYEAVSREAVKNSRVPSPCVDSWTRGHAVAAVDRLDVKQRGRK